MRRGGVFLSLTSSANLAALDATSKKLREVGRSSATTNKGLAGFGKSLAKVASATALIGLGVKAVNEATEAFKTTAMTEQLLKNTGLAASVTSQQIGDLAMQISNLTGIDDEQVQAASNVLIGFKDLVPAGKNATATLANLTQVATDLGVKMGKDPAAAAKMLGKALTDPAKGVALLYRAGIPLDKQLADRIKNMAKAGQLEQARALLLQNVSASTKGLAAATADPMQRLTTLLNNLLETVGTPILNALMPIISSLQPVFEALTPVLQQVGVALAEIITPIANALLPVLPQLLSALTPLLPVFGLLGKLVASLIPIVVVLTPMIRLLANILQYTLRGAIVVVVGVVQVLVSALRAMLGVMAKLPGIGKQFKPAVEALDGMKESLKGVAEQSLHPEATQQLEAISVNYKAAAGALADGAKLANTAASNVGKSLGKKTMKAKPKTTPKAKTATTSNQSFTVGASGGGLSLSVTVNGSVIQERDIARSIRDELLQFARRQGVNLNLGV